MQWSVEDYEKYAEWLNDFQVTDYTGRSSQILTIEAEKEYLEKNVKMQAAFAIVELDTDKLLGSVSIENIKFWKYNESCIDKKYNYV